MTSFTLSAFRFSGDHRRAALALAGDFERLELVDAGRELEVARRALPGGDVHLGPDRVEAKVGRDDLVVAGGHVRDVEPSRVIGEDGYAELG
jgi:hypothetical protein